jgi:predicted ABC-type transport system involved in lysophospholipase L1 biosynthesis ATPase subunit
MGPSGSGKSTLLSLLAGLDIPTQGSLKVLGESLEKLSEEQRTQFRAHNMSFVFQSFRLISTLTAKENVQIPLELLNSMQSEEKAKAPSPTFCSKIRSTPLNRSSYTDGRILFTLSPNYLCFIFSYH